MRDWRSLTPEERRAERDKVPGEFARKQHMDANPVSYTHLNTDPPAKYIVLICEYLGCSLEYLLTGQAADKAPVPGMSENGREMLELYAMCIRDRP